MKLSELIASIGDDNVTVQNLFNCLNSAKKLKGTATELSFGTNEVTTEEIMLDTAKKIALVVWIPKDKLPKG